MTDRHDTTATLPWMRVAETVSETAADLAGWLTGRITAPDWPALPRWL